MSADVVHLPDTDERRAARIESALIQLRTDLRREVYLLDRIARDCPGPDIARQIREAGDRIDALRKWLRVEDPS